MKSRSLGRTGLRLTELGFGGGAIGNLHRPVDREAAMATMQAAWDAGLRYFDTAPFYGHGLSERRVGDFLRDLEGWTLSTKVGRVLRPVPRSEVPDHGFADPLPFAIDHDYSAEGIRTSVAHSHARLGLNRIDILWVHDLEPATHGPDYGRHLETFLESGLPELNRMKRDGQIAAFGLGVNQVQPCLDVLSRGDLDAILLAGRYTLLDRSAEPALLPLCRERGVALVIGGVFNSGILATGPVDGALYDYGPAPTDVVEKVRALEREVAPTPLATAALNFPLSNECVAAVLIGTSKPASIIRNIEAWRSVNQSSPSSDR
ncbi:aldo/keto reductase [Roseisalinus antarcticus]|uniref:Pyridoxal 4-dehydrogenase n=1 Tax=Roseisalinus antarcticus TaxID=254357 RepID=A0A1Y5U3C3_9RHOB|nr:aldo/keto reductase [Roseisalinus antarcticus]SLN77487.1 Pyridoxal 4-dehydrogenase [Roseisalinus antarcticus]